MPDTLSPSSPRNYGTVGYLPQVRRHHLSFKSGASDARVRDQEEEFLMALGLKSGASFQTVWGWGGTLSRAGCVMGVSCKVRAR